MNITTEDEALLELYERGKTSAKKYRRLPVQAIKGYKKAVDYMRAARRIEELFPLNGLHYKKLQGDKAGLESVRCMTLGGLYFAAPRLTGAL